jgi:hypothetical protein
MAIEAPTDHPYRNTRIVKRLSRYALLHAHGTTQIAMVALFKRNRRSVGQGADRR